MSGRARYAAVLRMPHVTPLLVASMLARLPYGLFGLAVILYLAEERGSYAVAGIVNGAFAIGAAAGVPLQGRIIDRLGQTRVLVPAALLDAGATVLLIGLTEADAPTVALVACGLVGGLAVPNIGGALRTLWPRLLARRDELTTTAFALDSVAIELLFTVGPLIAAVIVAVASPLTAMVASAVCVLTGTALFVSQAPSREWRPHAQAGSHGRLGALRAAGVRTIVFSSLPVGFCFGAVEIALPAFAEEQGARELAGVLLAMWSIGSAIGGLAYGARNWPRPLGWIYLWLSVILPLGYLPALLSPSIAAMALLVLPAGLLIAPLGAAGNQLIARIAPAGAATEAYAWPVTAILVGFAVGSSLGGLLVESADWRACFVSAAAAAAIGGAVVYRYRGTLEASEPVPV